MNDKTGLRQRSSADEARSPESGTRKVTNESKDMLQSVDHPKVQNDSILQYCYTSLTNSKILQLALATAIVVGAYTVGRYAIPVVTAYCKAAASR